MIVALVVIVVIMMMVLVLVLVVLLGSLGLELLELGGWSVALLHGVSISCSPVQLRPTAW